MHIYESQFLGIAPIILLPYLCSRKFKYIEMENVTETLLDIKDGASAYICGIEAEAADATEASGTRLAKALQREYDTPTALAYMVFALFYFPCFATVIAMAVESGRRRIALHAILYTTTIAYLMALATRVACIFLAL